METARRLRSTIGSVFRYAMATARAESDPTIALKGALIVPRVASHAAITDPDALGGLLRAIEAYDGQPSTRLALKLLALLFTEIKRCEAAGATIVAVAMAYVCIDTMAFLSMPNGKSSQTKPDFIAWVDKYLKGDPRQPYSYDGTDVYAARCAVLHSFSAEAERHRKDTSIKLFGYHNGGLHGFDPNINARLVVIGTASFLNDAIIAVESFMKECEADEVLRQRVEGRLQALLHTFPFRLSPETGEVR